MGYRTGPLTSEQVRTKDDALVYLIECTLATVATMAFSKRRPKNEYKRQISMAQTGIDILLTVETDIGGCSRVQKVIENYGGSVAAWAKQWENNIK